MPAQVLINGAPLPLYYGSLRVREQVGSPATAQFDLVDKYGTFRPKQGDTVDARVSSEGLASCQWGAEQTDNRSIDGEEAVRILFGGSIVRVRQRLLNEINSEAVALSQWGNAKTDSQRVDAISIYIHSSIYSCEAADNNTLPGRSLINQSWSSKTLREIVLDIVGTLSDYSLNTDNVATGPTLDNFAASYDSGYQCFSRLSEITGYAWWITAGRALYFVPKGTLGCPYVFSDTSRNWWALDIEYEGSTYRNRQYIERSGGTISYRENATEKAIVGLWAAIEKNESITTANEADDYADGLLRRYCPTKPRIKLVTYSHGVHAGQQALLSFPSLNISGAFLVESVEASIPEDKMVSGQYRAHVIYTLSLTPDEPQEDFRAFFARKLKT